MSIFNDDNFNGFLTARNYGYNFDSSTKKVYEIARKKMNVEDAAAITRRFAIKRYSQLIEKLLSDKNLGHNEKVEISCEMLNCFHSVIFKDPYEYEDDMNEILAKKIREYADIIAKSHKKIV